MLPPTRSACAPIRSVSVLIRSVCVPIRSVCVPIRSVSVPICSGAHAARRFKAPLALSRKKASQHRTSLPHLPPFLVLHAARRLLALKFGFLRRFTRILRFYIYFPPLLPQKTRFQGTHDHPTQKKTVFPSLATFARPKSCKRKKRVMC